MSLSSDFVACFCSRCKMILSYDTHNKNTQKEIIKEDTLRTLSDQVIRPMAEIEELNRQGA